MRVCLLGNGYYQTPMMPSGMPGPLAQMFVALGANLPRTDTDPRETVAAAVDLLDAERGVAVVRVAPWIRSPAEPPGSGPDFVNGVVEVNSALSPQEMLSRLHAIERALGRERPARWAPRVCDLDLIAAGRCVLPDRATVARWMALSPEEAAREAPGTLILPHPRMHERAFVLVPLAEIAPAWRHPILGRTAAELRDDLPREKLEAIRTL